MLSGGSLGITRNTYSSITGNMDLIICIALIVGGVVASIISLCGCCGAVLKKSCMLNIVSDIISKRASLPYETKSSLKAAASSIVHTVHC